MHGSPYEQQQKWEKKRGIAHSQVPKVKHYLIQFQPSNYLLCMYFSLYISLYKLKSRTNIGNIYDLLAKLSLSLSLPPFLFFSIFLSVHFVLLWLCLCPLCRFLLFFFHNWPAWIVIVVIVFLFARFMSGCKRGNWLLCWIRTSISMCIYRFICLVSYGIRIFIPYPGDFMFFVFLLKCFNSIEFQ